ncbi:MAG: oligosaccharide flippase family protein [Brumimicrobium sp.]|nr:oligosaccharide flippase family protein [Brumimicrobium sp.]
MLRDYINKIKNSEFAVNSLKLMSGTTIAQMISFIMAPILYRIYEKEDYGVLGLFMAITGIIGVFSTFQYNQVIILVKTDEEASNAENLNRLINLFVSLTTIPLILTFGDGLADYFNSPNLKPWLFLLPVQLFFAGQNEIFRVKANRLKRYSILSMNTILGASITPIVSLILGFLLNGPIGLFIGLISGQLISTVYLQIKIGSVKAVKPTRKGFGGMRSLARKHYKFPLYSLPSELMNRAGRQIPVFFIGFISGEAAIGVYNLCVRMLSLPTALISGAVTEVFKKRAIDEYHRLGNCLSIYKKTGKVLFSIGIVPMIVLLLFGPDLFGFIFGEKWREAGVYAQIFAPMYFLQLLVSPLSYLYYIKEKLGEDLILHIGYVSSLLVLFSFSSIYLSLLDTLIYFSVINIVLYIIYLFRSYQFSK